MAIEGRMSAERLNNELISSYAFDDLSRITSINHSYNAKVISGQNYAYSPVGNILSRDIILGGRNNPPGIFTESFGYDSLDRVISSSRENGFSYDEVGNRTGSGEVYNNLNQLLSNNDFEFTYTGNGNVATKKNKKTNEVFEFYWDIENQLIQVQMKKNLTELSKTIDYKIDGTGRRIGRSVTDHLKAKASYARKYFYDNEDILLEFDENDQLIAAYLHGPGIDRPLAMLRDINKNSSFEDNEIFYYTRDNLGSIRELVNTQGKVVQRYSYGVYGTTRLEKDNPNDSQVFIENPYAYTGRIWEQETGLYDYRARYYSPETGRFLSEDPIGFLAGDFNNYRYVKDNPLIFVDPYGLFSHECFYKIISRGDAFVQWTGGLIVGVDKSAAQKRWIGYGLITIAGGVLILDTAAAAGAGLIVNGAIILSASAVKGIGIGVGLGGLSSFGIGLFGYGDSNGGISPSVSSGSASTSTDKKDSKCSLGSFCN